VPKKEKSHPPAEVTVSLQGSLETFALPDVLVLLSSTKKDGELRVVGGRVDGKIWLEKGQIVHANVGGRETSFVDAIFELLRLDAGTFNFDADSAPAHRSEPEMIDLVLADAQVRLGEWNDIARVVPNLDAVVDMAAEAPADEVKVTRDQWQLLRRVAGGRSVLELMEALGRTEFDTCKTVKELVDARLASIDVDAKPRAKASAPAPAVEEAPAAKAAKPAAVESEADRDAEPVRPSSVKANPKLDPSERAAAPAASAKADEPEPAKDELDALAELASRTPRKVRTTTNGQAEGAAPARPAANKSQVSPPVEEAKALVAQLAALSGDDEEEVAAKVTEHLASGGELPDVTDGDEPINRGLLLKFLSSVRN
jgi:hypothetical protein